MLVCVLSAIKSAVILSMCPVRYLGDTDGVKFCTMVHIGLRHKISPFGARGATPWGL